MFYIPGEYLLTDKHAKSKEKFLVIFLVMEQIFNLLSCTQKLVFTGDLLGSGTDG